jgi:hypothetical protein
MRTRISFSIMLVLFVFTLGNSLVLAQEQPQMSEEKRADYSKYYEKRKGSEEDQKVAYQLAQEFLKKYGTDDDQYTKAVRTFVTKYEEGIKKYDFNQAMTSKNYAKAMEVGREILKTEPENVLVQIQMVQAASQLQKTGNAAAGAEGLSLAKNALQLLEAGKGPDKATPKEIEDNKAYLNYAIGSFLVKDNPTEAQPYLLNAAKSNFYKSDAQTHYLLGTAIINGEYQTVLKDYNEKYKDKPESPEQKAAFENALKVGQKGVDSMARAVALSTKPEQQEFKKQLLTQLTEIYKDLHQGSDAGLNELIAGALSKPLPQ